MIDKLSLKLTSYFCTEAYDNVKDRAKIQYGLNVILSEGFKIICLILLFNLIHRQNYFYFSLLVLLTTRLLAGGFHVKGALNCLLLTILLFAITSIMAPLMPQLPASSYTFLGLVCLMIVLVRAPICTVRRPIKDNKKKLQYKIIAALSVALWLIILLTLESAAYKNIGFTTIFIQTIQLLIIKKS
jgi:accessory gene regulator B